jgi:hypothetical protein
LSRPLRRLSIRNRVGEFRLSISGRNHRDPNICGFLPQSFRDCPDRIFSCTIIRDRLR